MNFRPISIDTKTKTDNYPISNIDSPVNLLKGNMGVYVTQHLEVVSKPNLQFALTLAHEVRNPLTNINLSIELLEAEIKDGPLKNCLDIIKRGSARINDLISELLQEKKSAGIDVEKHSMHQLLNESLESAADRIALKHIAIQKNFAEEDYTAALDRPKIKIALTNIIINAIEAMTAGQGELKLVTKSLINSYIVQIEDNGCGMSKEHLAHIFKPYFTNKPAGLGLGLTATSEILRSNRIRMNVASAPGKGTCFILLFEKKRYMPSNRQEKGQLYPVNTTGNNW